MSRSERLRDFYARYVAARGGARDPRIERAFAAVAREPFAGPGPWSVQIPGSVYIRTSDDDPAYLYQDTLVALDAAKGINMGEPSLHARCLDALRVRLGETVLHVGAGSGYYTAILAQLVGEGGQVVAFEIDPDLARRAEANLAHLPWVSVEARSGSVDGLPPADAVYVNAGITRPCRAWLDALRPDGRLLFPLQPVGAFGAMLLVRRPDCGSSWQARFVQRAGFISCHAAQDDAGGQRLAAAYAGGGWEAVRSLRLDGEPDETSWFAGDGWWLSTRRVSGPRMTPLEALAQTCSTSYIPALDPETLRTILLTGEFEPIWTGHLLVMVDETPIEMIGRVLDELDANERRNMQANLVTIEAKLHGSGRMRRWMPG